VPLRFRVPVLFSIRAFLLWMWLSKHLVIVSRRSRDGGSIGLAVCAMCRVARQKTVDANADIERSSSAPYFIFPSIAIHHRLTPSPGNGARNQFAGVFASIDQ
jgi:hypothetical protein